MKRVKEKDQDTEVETSYTNLGKAHGGGRTEWKTEECKEAGSGSLTQLPWTILSPLTTHMDHMVGLF